MAMASRMALMLPSLATLPLRFAWCPLASAWLGAWGVLALPISSIDVLGFFFLRLFFVLGLLPAGSCGQLLLWTILGSLVQFFKGGRGNAYGCELEAKLAGFSCGGEEAEEEARGRWRRAGGRGEREVGKSRRKRRGGEQ
jgi:hypothetical protein